MTETMTMADLYSKRTIEALHKLDEDIPRPDDQSADELIRAILSYGNDPYDPEAIRSNPRTRIRRRVKSDADTVTRVFHSLVCWFGGGGELTGYMMARLRVDSQTFAELETLAMVLRMVNGGGTPAVDRWRQALGR